MHDLVYIIMTEVFMTPFIVFVVAYTTINHKKLNTKTISLLFILLAMMSGMLNTLNYYLLWPQGFLNQVTAFNISMFEMSVIISYLLYSAFNGKLSRMNSSHAKWMAILVGWNEVSMAIFLYTLAYGFGNSNIYVNGLNLFGAGITNYLFTVPMIVEMVFLLLLRKEDPLSTRMFIFIILMQATDPGLFTGPGVIPLTIAFSVIMVFALYIIISYALKNRNNLANGWRKQLNYFIFLIIFSSVGLMLTTVIPNPFGVKWIVFAISMSFSMVYYFLISFKFFDPSTHMEKVNHDADNFMSLVSKE